MKFQPVQSGQISPYVYMGKSNFILARRGSFLDGASNWSYLPAWYLRFLKFYTEQSNTTVTVWNSSFKLPCKLRGQLWSSNKWSLVHCNEQTKFCNSLQKTLKTLYKNFLVSSFNKKTILATICGMKNKNNDILRWTYILQLLLLPDLIWWH